MTIRPLTPLLVLLLASCVRAQALYFPPITGTNWATSSLSEAGFCGEGEQELYDFLEASNTDAFLLLKDGRIVIERYFGDFGADSPHLWNSAGKALMAFSVGIAADQGALDIQDPTADYLGTGWTNCPDTEADIRIVHQLTMTTGLDFTDDAFCTDPACLLCAAQPGTRWQYHNGPYTLLGQVIEQATGQGLNDFVRENIRNRTGISGQFVPLGDNRIFASNARSMARFGLLMLAGGEWDGQAILQDTAYFNAMINTSQELNQSYGYLWWLNGKESFRLPQSQTVFPGMIADNAPADAYAGMGKNSQIVTVVPSEGLVMVRMGGDPDDSLVPLAYNNNLWERINALRCPTSTQGVAPDESVAIYPNPADARITLSSPRGLRRVTVFVAGRRAGTQVLSGNQEAVEVGQYPQGVLMLRVVDGAGRVSWRRVVRR